MAKVKIDLYHSRGGWYKERIQQIADLSSSYLKGKVLDIGGSDGYLKEFCNSCKEWYVLDIDEQALKIARSRGCVTLNQDLNKKAQLNFDTDFFDVVICTEVLEHLLNPLELIKEVRRITKKKGIIIFSLPNDVFWLHRIAFLMGKSIDWEGLFHHGGHLHFPSLKQVSDFILSIDNLTVLKVDYYYNYRYKKAFFWNFLPTKVKKFLAYTFPSLFSRGVIYVAENDTETV